MIDDESARTLTSQLVQIDSVNPRLTNGGGEEMISMFLAEWMENAGLSVEVQKVLPGRQNVIGTLSGTGGGRSLLLVGHMDTVQPSVGQRRGLTGYRLYGCGACDMKGGLAANLLAAADATRYSLRGTVTVAGVVDEEHASLGTRFLLQRVKSDAAIVAESTGLRLALSHSGILKLAIVIAGPVGDCVQRDARRDMKSIASAMYSHFLRRCPPLSDVSVRFDLDGAHQGCMTLWLKFDAGEDPERLLDEVEEIAHHLESGGRIQNMTIRVLSNRHAFATDYSEPICSTVRQAVIEKCGAWPERTSLSGWTDAALLSRAGIPTVIFGPGGGGAHGPYEWIDLEQVKLSAQVLSQTIANFCS